MLKGRVSQTVEMTPRGMRCRERLREALRQTIELTAGGHRDYCDRPYISLTLTNAPNTNQIGRSVM